jgi:hypothetical protein
VSRLCGWDRIGAANCPDSPMAPNTNGERLIRDTTTRRSNRRSRMPGRAEPPGCTRAVGCSDLGTRQRLIAAESKLVSSDHGSSTSWE